LVSHYCRTNDYYVLHRGKILVISATKNKEESGLYGCRIETVIYKDFKPFVQLWEENLTQWNARTNECEALRIVQQQQSIGISYCSE
uniref:Ig-like domain-containing protein n=1 Tax=Mesocestoides corti TaxID=53468 RepID=A0A5K3FPD7_MESCO